MQSFNMDGVEIVLKGMDVHHIVVHEKNWYLKLK